MLDKIINFKLIENPANWAIVGLTVLIGAFAAVHVLPWFTNSNPQQ